MKKGDYKISDLYQGGYSSLDPGYGSLFTGYRASIGTVGITTDPRTANILKEVSDKIAPGQKTVELSMVTPEIVEAIPKPHLKEVNRLSKLTGVDITVHGPLVEASGLSKEGFSEANREAAERQMIASVEKTHEINPKEGVPITFHSSAMLPAPEIRKLTEEEIRRLKPGEKPEEIERLLVIDQESGQITPVKKEERFYPKVVGGKPVKEKYTAEKQVEIMNDTQWGDSITKLVAPKERADRILNETYPIVSQIPPGAREEDLTPPQREVLSRFWNAQEELQDIRKHLNGLFDRAYKYSSEHDKHNLKEIAKNFEKNIEKAPVDIKNQSSSLQQLMMDLTGVHPKLFKPVHEFAQNKTTTTFGNVAYDSYKKFGDKAPIISIENPPAGMSAFTRGEDLKNIVKESREKFVERAVKEGMSKGQAEKQAEKMIGVTWDVGHINQLRKFGFTKEDIIKETKEVAPYLKHIHLSDNFGLENVEMPMGMGNVPLKEMMEKLGKKADDVKKIVEAAHWWQHFQTSPMAQSFEALGSPIYAMKNAPYWNQAVGFQQGYFSGYGQFLPQINYETFGTSFSQLPVELGGQRPGAGGGRMSGTPME